MPESSVSSHPRLNCSKLARPLLDHTQFSPASPCHQLRSLLVVPRHCQRLLPLPQTRKVATHLEVNVVDTPVRPSTLPSLCGTHAPPALSLPPASRTARKPQHHNFLQLSQDLFASFDSRDESLLLLPRDLHWLCLFLVLHELVNPIEVSREYFRAVNNRAA